MFNPHNVKVIYVLGGPGAGKGTNCARLVHDYGFIHLCAGDLLREEQNRPGSSLGAMIKEHITNGTIVPLEVTVKLLENAMRDAMRARLPSDTSNTHSTSSSSATPSPASDIPDSELHGHFLIDGFPRKMDQAMHFDKTVIPASSVLYLVCPEKILLERLLERGKTSGRDDDNAESISKRFRTFLDVCKPVIDHYAQEDKVIEIDSSKSMEEVYKLISDAVKPLVS